MPDLSKFEDVDISTSSIDGKYKMGDVVDVLYDIKHRKPVFAFDYLSEDRNEYSLIGNNSLAAKDYKKFFSGLKRISSESYDTLSKNEQFHFHSVDWDDTTLRQSEFEKHIRQGKDGDLEITAYQVKLFEQARIFGFFYASVFYVILFDRNHNIYKRK